MKRTLHENQEAVTKNQRDGQQIVIITEGTYNKKIKDWQLNNELCNHPTWWVSNLDPVINQRTGCPECCVEARGLSKRVSIDDLKFKLLGRGIKIKVYSGVTNNPETVFECLKCRYEWKTSTASVIAGSGCSKCSNLAKLTEDEAIERIKGRSLKMVEYSGLVGKVRSKFKCTICNHIWDSTFNNIVKGRGCPVCAKTGFNPTKPAWMYRLLLDTPSGTCYGFGITNDIKGRMNKHRRVLKGMLDQEYTPVYFDSGLDALSLESEWKKSPHIVDIGVEGFRTECVLVNYETTKMIFK